MISFVVIVTYYPDVVHLHKMVDVINSCKCTPIIVDNSDSQLELKLPNSVIIQFHENTGIAHAQNVAILYAIEKKADIIGFFDQDSCISESLINLLISHIKHINVRCVVARSINATTGEEYPSQKIGICGIPRDVFADTAKKTTPVDIAISSGTFVKTDVFNEIGIFDEDFFIDYVDTEWCCRCHKSQIPIWIVNEATMKHKIGQHEKKIGPITINVHSPYRTYYKVRNPFLLFRKKLGFLFCMRQVLPALIHNSLLLFDSAQGKEYRKFYFRGIRDGIKNRCGKYESWNNN